MGDLIDLTAAEQMNLFAAVGTGDIAHVLDQAQDRNVHQLGHAKGFFHDHADQVLGCRYDDDARDGQGLEDCQGHITGAGGHIHEHVIHIAPDDFLPELLEGACDDRAPPDDRRVLLLHQQVHGHDLDACDGGGRMQAFVGGDQVLIAQAEHFGHAGPRNVRVQDTGLIAVPSGPYSRHGGHGGFAYAAFAADHCDHFFHFGLRMRFDLHGLCLGSGRCQFLFLFAHILVPLFQLVM